MFLLRDYQEHAVQVTIDFICEQQGHPLIVAPTGTGKSAIIAALCKEFLFRWPSLRILKVTHSKNIIEQNADKLTTFWPQAPLGIYSAGLGVKEKGFPITFAGIDSIARNYEEYTDILIIDEAHLLSPKEGSRYHKLIDRLKKLNNDLRVIGLTATPFRLGQGELIDSGLFTDIVVDYSSIENFNWFIDTGYLCSLIPQSTSTTYDVSSVKQRGGEFIESEVQKVVDKKEITEKICQEIIEKGADRAHWLIFCSGIDHTEHTREILHNWDIPSSLCHSKLTSKMNDQAINLFKSGKIRALCNNGMLTTGFDFPGIDLIALLRPTASPGLHVQILGRGTRTDYALGYDLSTENGRLSAIAASSKQNCLVLDFSGNTKRLGPINDPIIPRRKGKGGGEAPVKECPICSTLNHASVRICIFCGHEFQIQTKMTAKASIDEIIVRPQEFDVRIFSIDRVTYSLAQKQGMPPYIRISYYSGLRRFIAPLCIEHKGVAGKKAKEEWFNRSGYECPATVKLALEYTDYLKVPTHIKVWIKKQGHNEILDYDFSGSGFTI